MGKVFESQPYLADHVTWTGKKTKKQTGHSFSYWKWCQYLVISNMQNVKNRFLESSIFARNISNLEMNFSLKYKVISIIFGSYLSRTWWLNWWTPKIFILIYDWRIIFHYWIICVTVSCHLRMMSLDYLFINIIIIIISFCFCSFFTYLLQYCK